MTWPTVPLASIASRLVKNHHLLARQDLWHPKPSHIAAKTGRILRKEYESIDNLLSSYVYFDKGNVLLSKFRPELSRVAVADEAGIGGNFWIALQSDTRVLDPQFLALYLRSPLFRNQAARHSVGSVIPLISEKWFNTHHMPLPPLVEQQYIVMILDKTNHLLQLQDAANHNAQAVLRAQYLTMFGDQLTNPMHLQKACLGDLVEWQVGTPLNESDSSAEGGYPVYDGSGNLRRTHQWLCDANTIILTRAGRHCGDVGYVQEKTWVTAHAMFVRKKYIELEDRYLLTALVLAQLGKIGGSVNRSVLSVPQVQSIDILLPDWSQQQKFARFAEKVASIAQLQTVAGRHLTHLWRKLQDQAFSGQLSAKASKPNT